MKGTRILAGAGTRGVFEDIFVTGTPKPGTVMELEPDTAAVGGVFTYAAYGTEACSSGNFVDNDGDRKAIAILLEKDQEGKTYDDAYADGDMGRVYFPAMGEKANMLVENQSGTGDSFGIGDELMVDNGTGKLMACDTDAEAHPFTCLEVVSALTADGWAYCRFNGAGGA